jgi:hypothetical protein
MSDFPEPGLLAAMTGASASASEHRD